MIHIVPRDGLPTIPTGALTAMPNLPIIPHDLSLQVMALLRGQNPRQLVRVRLAQCRLHIPAQSHHDVSATHLNPIPPKQQTHLYIETRELGLISIRKERNQSRKPRSNLHLYAPRRRIALSLPPRSIGRSALLRKIVVLTISPIHPFTQTLPAKASGTSNGLIQREYSQVDAPRPYYTPRWILVLV